MLEPGTYCVRVYGYASAIGTYRLSIDRWDFVFRPPAGGFELPAIRPIP